MTVVYSEEYRGHTVRVARDDSHPIVVVGGNTFLTVAAARRGVDHFLDRSCAAHGRCSGDSLTELYEDGVYAGVECDVCTELAADQLSDGTVLCERHMGDELARRASFEV